MIWLGLIVLVGVLYWLCMSPWAQLFGSFPYHASTHKKIIALTFDDGPNEPYTSELLDLLKRERIKATFFVVGACLRRHPKVAKRIVSEGHVIGNHSQSHRFTTYFKPGAFLREIQACQKLIEQQTGKTPALFRTPWLWRHPLLLKQAKRLGLSPVGGEFCHSREVFSASAETIARGALAKAKPGAIIIFHDGKEGTGGDRSATIEAVKITIASLKKRGYTFVTADELLGIPTYQTSAGAIGTL